VSIKFVEKEERRQEDDYKYRTSHKPNMRAGAKEVVGRHLSIIRMYVQ